MRTNWRTYKYTPNKDSQNRFSQTPVKPIALFILLITFVFLAYMGVTAFIKNIDKIGLQPQNDEEGRRRIENIQPPLLSNIPRHTNNETIPIEGFSIDGAKIELYHNGEKIDEKIADAEGAFKFDDITLEKGENEFYAISSIGDQTSVPSSRLTINYDSEPPTLEVEFPTPDVEVRVREGERTIEVRGETEPNTEVKINNRIALVDGTGVFTARINIEEGENELRVEATDQAGNKTTVDYSFTVEYTDEPEEDNDDE